MNHIFTIRGRKITAKLLPHAMRITSDAELDDLLGTDTEEATDELVKSLKEKYHSSFGNAFAVSDASLAVEIWGHVFADRVAEIVKNLSPFPFVDGMADKIMYFCDVIDVGEKGHDNNRFVWDALARFKSMIAVLLPAGKAE